jgi:toxin ParE1/3/4
LKRLHLSPKAQSDLAEIWDFTAENWGTARAEGYVRAIQKACNGLCDGSSASTAIDHVRQGYRKRIVGSHLLLFRESDDTIAVIRNLHKRMDPDRHL